MKTLAFDIEIVKDIPEGAYWKTVRPLGISCASTLADGELITWYHGKSSGKPLEGAMTLDENQELVRYMMDKFSDGYVPITWNGLQFDFDVLAEESKMWMQCVRMALNHVDMMFYIFCIKGYPIGLETVAKGLGLSGKTEGMSGAKAPEMWRSSLEDRQKVLEYVGQDSITTQEIFDKAIEKRGIYWLSKSGRPQEVYMGNTEWKTVLECLEFPLPDNSWMTKPLLRSDFMSWILDGK